MLKVGLTGGIACGKSTVGAMLAARGAHVIKADEIGHRLMRPGQPVYEEIVRRFGRQILDSRGLIDRNQLAAVAFASDQPRIAELNQIVHPAVIAEQNRWAEEIGRRDPRAIAVVEAALILEAGIDDDFDRLVVVICDPGKKVERLAGRLGIGAEAARREVERRSAAQLPDAEKQRRADFVIYNNGSVEETASQVDSVYAALAAEAQSHK